MTGNDTNKGGAGIKPASSPIGEWADRNARHIFIWPAVLLILLFSLFPLIASAILAFSRVKLGGGGYTIKWAGFANFQKQLFGSQQEHFLGRFEGMSVLGMVVSALAFAGLVWWLIRAWRDGANWLGMLGRLISACFGFGVVLMFSATLLSGTLFGTLGTTLFYVFVGCAIQFVVGLGLALLCSQPIRARTFFRVLFFLPMMITPIGIGYIFRMMADTSKGPFSGLWEMVGLGDFAWNQSAWAARFIIVLADSWQWIPFIFVVMLAALENVSRDMIEAGHVDGASEWQIFREITWPQVVPVAATVMLIRAIEAFKLVDLPNIMTAGGPGIATESMTLHAFYVWRTPDLAQSAAISYLLLFVTVVTCVTFFNLVVLKRRVKDA